MFQPGTLSLLLEQHHELKITSIAWLHIEVSMMVVMVMVMMVMMDIALLGRTRLSPGFFWDLCSRGCGNLDLAIVSSVI